MNQTQRDPQERRPGLDPRLTELSDDELEDVSGGNGGIDSESD